MGFRGSRVQISASRPFSSPRRLRAAFFVGPATAALASLGPSSDRLQDSGSKLPSSLRLTLWPVAPAAVARSAPGPEEFMRTPFTGWGWCQSLKATQDRFSTIPQLRRRRRKTPNWGLTLYRGAFSLIWVSMPASHRPHIETVHLAVVIHAAIGEVHAPCAAQVAQTGRRRPVVVRQRA